MPDLNQPLVSEVTRAHFFVSVIIRRIFRINQDMPIVVRRTRVIAPNVRFSDLMIRIIRSSRQVRIVSENLSDLENSRRRAAISLLLSKTRLVLPG